MDYQVLYRKYRPKNFDEVIGQKHITTILKNSIVNNKIAHTYIFTGPRGTGKTSSARIFAKTLNCLNPKDGICCEECENCLDFNSSPNIVELDAASNNGVDEIREIVDNVNIAPTNGKYKIYIIDEVHMLTSSAWNAFLKTLEEPPESVVFILATTEIKKVPITVLSRCQRFDFKRIDVEEIKNNLINICDKEKIKYEEEALREIAILADGCMRDALSLLDQLSRVKEVISLDIIREYFGLVTSEDIDNIYASIINNDIDGLVRKIQSIKQSGVDVKNLIEKLIEEFIDKAISIKKKGISNNAFKQLKHIIDRLNDLIGRLNQNSNGYLLLELELISFIKDDINQISQREIKQIISQEIIKVDTKIDVNDLLKPTDISHYKMCDEFIKLRINNTLAKANKEFKKEFNELWSAFNKYIEDNNVNEFKQLVIKSVPTAASDEYVVLGTTSEALKTIGNTKLFDIESLLNSKFDKKYKLIFVKSKEWNDFTEKLKSGIEKIDHEIRDESDFIQTSDSSVDIATDLFGSKINIQ